MQTAKKNHTQKLGPGNRTAEEAEATRVRKTHPPIAADLSVPLFVSENPSGFHPDTPHYTPRTT